MINGRLLDTVYSFCGLTVDCFLTHNVHINNIINKRNKLNYVSALVKTYIPNSRLRSSCISMFLHNNYLGTGTYKGVYTNIIDILWNQLPPALRMDQSFCIFVDELVFYLSKFKNTFLCNNVCS